MNIVYLKVKCMYLLLLNASQDYDLLPSWRYMMLLGRYFYVIRYNDKVRRKEKENKGEVKKRRTQENIT